MPLLLQLALADGLRRGRRTAAMGTIGLQAFLALCSILSANLASFSAELTLEGGSSPALAPQDAWNGSNRVAVPIMLNIGIVLLVVWNREHLGLHTRPGVVRKAVGAWAAIALVCAVASVGLGMAVVGDFRASPPIAEGFQATATPLELLLDFLARWLYGHIKVMDCRIPKEEDAPAAQ